jgi:hypothetical protein
MIAMPKMEQLIQIIYKLAPAVKEEVNEETKRFIFTNK